jgi:hypothetical protein
MDLHVYERYVDPDACRAHLPTWGEVASRFKELVDITKFTVFSELPDDVKEMLGDLEPVYMTPIGGFVK